MLQYIIDACKCIIADVSRVERVVQAYMNMFCTCKCALGNETFGNEFMLQT